MEIVGKANFGHLETLVSLVGIAVVVVVRFGQTVAMIVKLMKM